MLLQFAAGSDNSSADKLSSVLEQCRDELDAIRQDLAWNNGGNGRPGDLDGRLRRTAERLQQAIGRSERIDRLISDGAPAAAAAPILTREAEHRIKNGFTTVLALLHRQAATATDAAVAEALRVAGARVAAVAQLQVFLSDIALVRGEDREVALGPYLHALCGAIINALELDGGPPIIRVAVEPLPVTPNTAQSLGLIVTELVTNSLRHAFGHRRGGTIEVSGERVDGAYLLSVEDDGNGPSPRIDGGPPRAGLGLRLVDTLAEDLRARVIRRTDRGTRVTLVLREPLAG